VTSHLLGVFRSRRMAVLLALGFSSGLPLYLTAQTLQAWLGTAHVDVERIAAFALLGLPYTFKFAWAPLLDRWRLPWLGRRRGWMLALQLALIAAIAAMGTLDPQRDATALVMVGLAVAIASASQDVVLDAYSTDLLAPDQRAAGAGVYVTGYRIAVLVSGSLALVLADQLPWRVVYAIMAALMSIGVIATLAAEEPPAIDAPRTLQDALIAPFADFVHRLGARGAIAALAFAALYRFGDQLAQVLITTFFQTGPRLSLTEIGALNKTFGFIGTVIGAGLGGALVARHGLWRMLLAFGALQAVTNLLYVWLAVRGHDLIVFSIAVTVDNLADAMGTGAFVAYLMSLCSPGVSATQFALLTSLSSVGKRVFGPLAGSVQHAVGWTGFFVVTALCALPGLAMVGVIRRADTRRRPAGSPPASSPSAAA